MKRLVYWLNERKHLRKRVIQLEEQVKMKDQLMIRAAELISKERESSTSAIIALQVRNQLLKDKLGGVS